MSKPLTPAQENRVLELKRQGWGRERIAKEVGLSKRRVRYILAKHGLGTPMQGGKQPTDVPMESRELFLQERVRHLGRELNRRNKGQAFEDAILELFRDVKPLANRRALPRSTRQKTPSGETLCLMLSDFHMGEEVDSAEVMDLNEYSTDIAVQRVHQLATGVRSIASKMTGYNFEALNIFELGDMVSGIIHEELLQGTATVDQVVICARTLADLTADLSELFPVVNVVGVIGNHGRMTKKPKFKKKWDNFDYLVYKFQEQICSQLENVSFNMPKSAMAMVQLYKWNFLLRHGDGKSQSYAGIPFYGILRGDGKLTQVLAQDNRYPHYHLLGHYHTQNTLEKVGGKIIMNGSLVGTGEYSWNAMFGSSEPKQKLFSVHPEHGVTWEMDLNVA